jgi:hypothetical protein
MCLHSAYEVGGAVYVRGLDPKPPARATESNTCSDREHDDPKRPTEPERALR